MGCKKLLTVVGSLSLMISIASADNIHVMCVSPSTCAPNGTDLSLSNNPSTFEYGLQGNLTGTGSGDFWLIALVPNNEVPGFNASISATHTATSPGVRTDAGAFTGNGGTELSTVLDNIANGFSGLGNGHPLSSYLDATQTVDAAATGYEVFLYGFGLVNFSSTTNPIFTDQAMPLGSVFTALVTADGTKNVTFDSPNSEGLLVAHTSTVPEPREYSALLLLGMVGFFGFARRRSQA